MSDFALLAVVVVFFAVWTKLDWILGPIYRKWQEKIEREQIKRQAHLIQLESELAEVLLRCVPEYVKIYTDADVKIPFHTFRHFLRDPSVCVEITDTKVIVLSKHDPYKFVPLDKSLFSFK